MYSCSSSAAGFSSSSSTCSCSKRLAFKEPEHFSSETWHSWGPTTGSYGSCRSEIPAILQLFAFHNNHRENVGCVTETGPKRWLCQVSQFKTWLCQPKLGCVNPNLVVSTQTWLCQPKLGYVNPNLVVSCELRVVQPYVN